jgi:hypothetical protein
MPRVEPNPYQAPAEMQPLASSGTARQYRREEKQLVVKSGVVLPLYCVKTGEPITEEDLRTRTLTYSPSYVIILIVLSLLIGLIVYLIVRKKCTLTFGLSPRIRSKYRNRVLIALFVAILCVGGIFLSVKLDNGMLMFASIVLMLVSLVVVLLGGSPLTAANHVNGRFWIKGCSRAFLDRIESGEDTF